MAHKRVRENWLWIVPLILVVVLTPPPKPAFGSIIADRLVDVAGFVVIILGALVRLAARSFKHEHGTDELVASGPYAQVRHPLYLGTLMCGFGVAVIHGSLIVIAAFVVSFIAWYTFVIRREEVKLRARWPEAHAAYARAVPMLFPGPRRLAALFSAWPDDMRAAVIRESDALFLWPMAGLAVRAWGIFAAPLRTAADVTEARVLGGVTLFLGITWLVVKHGLRRTASSQAG